MNMTIAFTTTSANYELFTDANVVAFLMDRWAITAEEVPVMVAKGLDGSAEVYFSNSQISFNNSKYQVPLSNVIYETGSRRDLKSLRILNTAVTGTLVLKV